jgi:hypothetical protein
MSGESDEYAFKIPIELISDKHMIKKDMSTDLELANGDNPLYELLFNADDEFKKLTIRQQSNWYTTDIKYLSDTQKILKMGIPDIPEYTDIMKFYSAEVIPDDFRSKYSYVVWDKIEFINKSAEALQYMSLYNISSPVMSLLLPVIMLLIPFFMLKLQNGNITWETYCKCLQQVLRNHSLGQIFYFSSTTIDKQIMIITSLIFYLVQVYFNAQSCMTFVKNMIEIHDQIFCVRQYLNATIVSFEHIEKQWSRCSTYQPFSNNCKSVSAKAITMCKELDNISQLSYSITKISDIGKTMRAYYMLNIDKEWRDVVKHCIQFNSYIHSMKCLKEKLGSTINLCKYGSTTSFSELVYPLLQTTNAIGNNVTLDKNIIITGPNAAGKTTLIKAVLINTLLCQQFGCGYFKKAKIYPYHVLSSYINIPDTSGRDSLFQAEATRCKAILDDVMNDPNVRHLCIFDELFSGTNPYEAISAATSYLKCIGERKNIKFVLTTHFLDLCNRLDLVDNVKNMQMQVDEDKNLDFKYSYKMIDGISKVKGGIKVFRDLGYPESIINECSTIIAEIKL